MEQLELIESIGSGRLAKVSYYEVVVMAAIEYDNMIYAGAGLHAQIIDAMIDYFTSDGESTWEIPDEKTAVSGFVTNKGRFLNREEAEELAKKTNRWKEISVFCICPGDGMHSPNLKRAEDQEYEELYEGDGLDVMVMF